ncbi:MAG: DUF167 domain-containing protein [Dehalococcoidia bacterium]
MKRPGGKADTTNRMQDSRTTLEVHVQPGARKNELVGLKEDVLYIKVTAPPRKGEANRAVLELLSRALGVPRGGLDIIRGHTSRNKIIGLEGVSADELKRRLAQVVQGKDSSSG